MEESKSGFNIMNLLSQSAAKINAMQDMNAGKKKFESQMPSTAFRCADTAPLVYHYLRGLNPSLASSLLDIHPDVDMYCKITLEEVVEKWKMMTDEAAASNGSKSQDEANVKVAIKKHSIGGKSSVKDDYKAIHNNKKKIKKRSSILDNDSENVGVGNTENENENDLTRKHDGRLELKVTRKSRLRESHVYFTPEEDTIIQNKMKDMGDELKMKELAEELGRPLKSVINRVRKLKNGSSRIHRKMFSLAEDEAIMERVLPGLQDKKLCELVLHCDRALEDLATALGRPSKGVSLFTRWTHRLQPWLMQHYAGTVNLDIRMMLVNHVAETYQNRESVDWDAIAEKTEFAGNTALHLQKTYSLILKNAKRKFNTEIISWEQMCGSCKEYVGQAKVLNSKEAELRRSQVIQYFENYVKKQEIGDFL